MTGLPANNLAGRRFFDSMQITASNIGIDY